MNQSIASPKFGPDDRLTIASVAIVVYAVSTMLHEGLGHAGACLLAGGKALMVSTVAMDCSAENRLVIAAGTLVNFAAAAIFFMLLRAGKSAPQVWRYCLWLAMTVNLYTAAGYFLFSGLGGFGDWAMFIQGFRLQWAWRAGMALFGLVAYMLAVRVSLMELRPLIGRDKDHRVFRATRLSLTAYFAGGALACVAGTLNPNGWILVALSAAASTFGGTSGLAWGTQWLRGHRIPIGEESAQPPAIGRSWAWVGAAAICACVFIGVLGPGLKFGS